MKHDDLDLVYEPSGGFMRTLDEYSDMVTDAPAVFRPFAALITMAAVIGRRVTAPFSVSILTLNLYLCILAASSFAHKTTMITLSKRLIRDVRPELLLPDDFTPERLIELLAKQPEAMLAWPEFAGFLSRSGRDYNSGSRELLMEMYDAPTTFRRELKSNSITITEPSLSIFAASATSWLSDQLKGADLRSGFLNRFCFVLAEGKSKSYPIPSPVSQVLHNRAVVQLKAISDIRGTADLSGITARYSAWYRDLEREAERSDQVEIISAFYTRLSVTALKIAVLVELSTTQNLRVSDATLEEAIVLADYLRATVRHLLRVEFASTQTAKETQRLLQVIRKNPGIRVGWIYKQTGYNKRTVTDALGILREQNAVVEEDGKFYLEEATG